jgi:hypothetical protein
MRRLTTDLDDVTSQPYFLWDEDISIEELRESSRNGSQYERERLKVDAGTRGVPSV